DGQPQQVAAADLPVAGVPVDRDDLPAGDQLGDAAPADHEDERRDDRLDAQPGDEQPVPQPERQAQGQAERERDGHAVPLADQVARHRPADRDHRAHRQVDAAGGDDHRHAERHHDQRRAEPEDVDQAAVQVAVPDPDGEEAGRDDRVDDQQQEEHRDRPEQPVPGQVREGRDAHDAPFAIVSRSRSGVRVPSLASSATSARSRSTSTLWDRRSTSSSSAEMNSTPMPSPASDTTSRWISVLAPTSMPRVGSSRTSSRGRVMSQRASSTFCWLPPLRLRTGVPGDAGRIRSVLMYSPTSSSRRRDGSGRVQPRAAWSARTWSSATVRSMTRPSPLRSSGQNAMPWSIAARGVRSATVSPPIRTRPVSAGSAPDTSRASSERPDPSSPASPTTSPSWISRSTGAIAPVRPAPSRASRRSPRAMAGAASSSRSRSRSSRPVMRATRSKRPSSPIGYSPT